MTMIGQAEPKQSEAYQSEDFRGNVASAPENVNDLVAEPNLISDLSKEDTAQQKKKRHRQMLRWSIYSLLGFGVTALVAMMFTGTQYTCGTKARSSEARLYVGTIGRGQQAFWLENGAFGRSIPSLGLGISEETDNYKYGLQSFEFASYQYGVPKNDNVKSFVGAVFVVPEKSQTSQGSYLKANQMSESNPSAKKELTTIAILCESPKTGVKQKLPNPFLQNGTPTCAEGTVAFN